MAFAWLAFLGLGLGEMNHIWMGMAFDFALAGGYIFCFGVGLGH